MTALQQFSVTVDLTGRNRSALLSLVSTLHRRSVDVLSAELTRATNDGRAFTATFHATSRQARTLEASLRNLVDVVGVEMCETADLALTPATSGGPMTSGAGLSTIDVAVLQALEPHAPLAPFHMRAATRDAR